jgi:hypothetical protein
MRAARAFSLRRQRLERSETAFVVFLASSVPALASVVALGLPVFPCSEGYCAAAGPGVDGISWFAVMLGCAAFGALLSFTVSRLTRTAA